MREAISISLAMTNEPMTRLPQYPFHEIVDDLNKPQIVFRNSITIDPRGELPMRQESTADLSFLDTP